MFDYFSDVIGFLQSVVYIINWAFSFLRAFLGAFRGARVVAQVFECVSRLPFEVGALVSFAVVASIFDFIRGRK